MAKLIKNGSRGDDVLRLQQILNTQGYGLDEDSIFGNLTERAVRDYQGKNGLDVDGIVGDQTWGSLEALASAGNVANPDQTETAAASPLSATQAELARAEANAPSFQQSQALTDALDALQARLGQQPDAYQSPYAKQIEELYQKASAPREPFTYDPNADPVYQMYRDRYTQNARQSMQDTMADAAALTGGYGNSYAQAVAQQAYDRQMTGLNDALPQLYEAAYGRYNDEYNQLLQRLGLAQEMDQTEYGRYRDTVQDYYDRLSAERALTGDMYDREYQQYQDALNMYLQDRAYYYQKSQDELAQQNYLQQLALAQMGGGSSGGSSGRSSGSSGKSSGGTAATSTNYKTVLATAKGMTDKKAVDYVGRMVDQGIITEQEGYKITAVEMGIDMSDYTGSGKTTVADLLAASGKTGSAASAASSAKSTSSSSSKTSGTTNTSKTAGELTNEAAVKALKKKLGI